MALGALFVGPTPAVSQNPSQIFDPEIEYEIETGYQVTTIVDLTEFLDTGVSGVNFVLASCDADSDDYYTTITLIDSELYLTPNQLGQIHGRRTQLATTCSVTGSNGMLSESQDFDFSIPAYRTPLGLQSGSLTATSVSSKSIGIGVLNVPDGTFLRLGWRKQGSSPKFGVVSELSSGSVVTITGLEANTNYEVRGQLLNRQSYDLYRRGQAETPGRLIPEANPSAKWIGNIPGGGLGKSQSLNASTNNLPGVAISDAGEIMESPGAVAVFVVSLSSSSSSQVSVAYQTTDGSAISGQDYTSESGTLTFLPGQTSLTINIPVLDDEILEMREGFSVVLSQPAGVAITDDEGVATIIDNEQPPPDEDEEQPTPIIDEERLPSIRIEDAGIIEEATGAVGLFAVMLSEASTQKVTVRFRTVGHTADEGNDFIALEGMLTFLPAETTKTIRIAVVSDSVDEPDEDFSVVLSAPTNAVILDEQGDATIVDRSNPHLQDWLDRFGGTTTWHIIEAIEQRLRWRCPPRLANANLGGTGITPRCRVVHRDLPKLSVDLPYTEKWQPGVLTSGTIGPRSSWNSKSSRDIAEVQSVDPSALQSYGHDWNYWGRFANTRLVRSYEGSATNGEVETWTFGTDFLDNELLAGVLVFRSEGRFSFDGSDNRIRSRLTGVYPYVQYSIDERLSIWSSIGGGNGHSTLYRDGDWSERAKLSLTMAVVGARQELSTEGEDRFSLVLKSDAMVSKLVSDNFNGEPAVSLNSYRLRLGLEGLYSSRSDSGDSIEASWEVGIRYDSGVRSAFVGLEIGAGLHLMMRDLNLSAEINATGLWTKSSNGLADWGTSASLRYDPNPNSELGSSVEVSPSWGRSTSGISPALRQFEIPERVSDSLVPTRFDVLFGYGFATGAGRGVGTPYTAWSFEDRIRTGRLGFRQSISENAEWDIEASISQHANNVWPQQAGISIEATMNW